MAIQPADNYTVNPSTMFTTSPTSASVPAADASADKANVTIKKEPISPTNARKASVATQKRTTTSAAVLSRKDDPEKRASHNAIERARRESLNSRFLILAASLPAISQIRRPSKSLIVNRSLQFVADSLSREVLYRDMIASMHARNRQLTEELNAYKARAGQADLCEPLPPLEPALPRALTDIEKDRASSRPKNGISSGTLPNGAAAHAANDNLARAAARAAEAAAAAINAAAAHGMDDYEDFDGEAEDASANGSAGGAFPLSASGLEGLQINNANGVFSPNTFDSGFGQVQHFLQSAQYLLNGHEGAAAAATHMPAFVAPAHLNGNSSNNTNAAASGSPSSASPPELSSSASSAGGVSSPLSVSSVTSSSHHHQQFDQQQQQHYPPLSAAALAAAAAAASPYGKPPAPGAAHMHARSMTAPAGTSSPVTTAHEIASIYAAAAAHAQQQHSNSTPSPHTPTTPMPGPHGHAHAHFDLTAAYLQQQQQHAYAAAHAAAAQAIAAQQQHHQQQQGHGHQQQQQQHYFQQQHFTAPQHHAGPLPSPFLAAPAHYIASV